MGNFLRRFTRDSKGATAVEYGLICALVVIASVAALSELANTSVGMWKDVATAVTNH